MKHFYSRGFKAFLIAFMAIFGFSLSKAQTSYTGQLSATLNNVWLDGVGSADDRSTVVLKIDYTATWNSDKTITFQISLSPSNIVGAVPQMFLNGGRVADFSNNSYTTSEQYEEGATPNYAFFIAYNGGASDQIPFNYTVGASNDSGNTGGNTGGGNEGGGQDQSGEGNGVTFNGTSTGNFTQGDNSVPYSLDWSITWNENKTLTVSYTALNSNVSGLSPASYLNIGGAEKGAFSTEDGKQVFTTTDTFNQGETPDITIKFMYTGGDGFVTLDYTVGSTNSSTTDPDPGENPNPSPTEGNGATFYGIWNATVSNVEYPVSWSATWNKNKTVSFVLIGVPDVTGMVPKVLANGDDAATMASDNGQYTGTTTAEYEQDTTPFSFELAYSGGSTGAVAVDYNVGASNTKPTNWGETNSGTTTPEPDPTPDTGITGNGKTYTGAPVTATISDGNYKGQKVTIDWSATWVVKGGYVDFALTLEPSNFDGLAPQLFVDGAYEGNFEGSGAKWTYTTKNAYKEGETPKFALFLAVAGGNSDQLPISYTVGAEGKADGSTTPDDEKPEIEDPGDGTGNGATYSGTVKGTFTNATLPGSNTAADVPYTAVYVATWNKDATVTITLTIDPVVVGLVPQLFVDGVYSADFTSADGKFTLTTKDVFKAGEEPFDLYFAYAGGAVKENLPYIVGATGNDGSTAITTLNGNRPADGIYYNLQGMPVKNPTHGIFILNGKKVIL